MNSIKSLQRGKSTGREKLRTNHLWLSFSVCGWVMHWNTCTVLNSLIRIGPYFSVPPTTGLRLQRLIRNMHGLCYKVSTACLSSAEVLLYWDNNEEPEAIRTNLRMVKMGIVLKVSKLVSVGLLLSVIFKVWALQTSNPLSCRQRMCMQVITQLAISCGSCGVFKCRAL